MNIFSKKLTELMERDKINDENLGEMLNVNRTTISRWRSGARSPKLLKLEEIAKIFNVDTSVFVAPTFQKDYDSDLLNKENGIKSQHTESVIPKLENGLGWSIKSLRKQQMMTQKGLSNLTGYSQNTISNHENGNRTLDELDIRRYATAFKVTPQDLFDLAYGNAVSRELNNIFIELNSKRQQIVLDFATQQLDDQKKSALN